MSLIMESWRSFLNEETEYRGSPSGTRYSTRIDRLVGVADTAAAHLKEFIENIEIIYDEANIKKDSAGYEYLGLAKKWPSELDNSKKYNMAVRMAEASMQGFVLTMNQLFDSLSRGTTKNLFPDEIKKLKTLVQNTDKNIFRDIVNGRHYPQVSYATLARSETSFNERKQMVEERLSAIEAFVKDVLIDYIHSHNVYTEWANKQPEIVAKKNKKGTGVNTVSRKITYKFPIDIAPQLKCQDKIAYFEEIIRSYENNPNIIGRMEDIMREEVDFEEMTDEPSPYEKCIKTIDIEKTAQQSTDAEMAAFDLDEE